MIYLPNRHYQAELVLNAHQKRFVREILHHKKPSTLNGKHPSDYFGLVYLLFHFSYKFNSLILNFFIASCIFPLFLTISYVDWFSRHAKYNSHRIAYNKSNKNNDDNDNNTNNNRMGMSTKY